MVTRRPLLREIALAYPIPIAIALLAWIPLDSFRGIMFSYDGLGWLLLMLSFPWLLIRLTRVLLADYSAKRRFRNTLVLALASGYIPLSIACAYSLIAALNPPYYNETLLAALRWFYIPASFIGGGW